jgi:predicted transcriptional regulator
MAKNKNKDFDFGAEFDATPEVAETHELQEADVVENEEGTDRQLYTLKDGSEGSRAAYIRELFMEENMSRKDIAEQTGFPYRVVYSATVNMVNEAEPAGRGRAVTNPMIKVHGEDKALVKQDASGNLYDAATGDLVDEKDVEDTNRNEWIKEQVEAGVGRGDIAKLLELSYGVIYNLTKDQDGTRVRHDIELEDGTVISRSEYIRQLFAEGQSRSDIAKELDVPYSVVWQATKVEKTDADRFTDIIEQVKSFADKVVDEAVLEEAIAVLESVEVIVKEEVEEPATEAAAEEA